LEAPTVDIHTPFYLAGRVLLGGFFIVSGLRHFQHLPMMAGFTGSKGVPSPKLAVMVSGLMIILGGISILLGVRPHWGIALVTLFLLPVTFLMHQYWKHTDPMMRINDQVNFMKNIALLGASWMLLMIPQPWPSSLGL
jgi:putative oxidoreductase